MKVGLTARCMSPEHSSDEGNDRESPDSDEDAPVVPKKVLKVRPLSWRSDRTFTKCSCRSIGNHFADAPKNQDP